MPRKVLCLSILKCTIFCSVIINYEHISSQNYYFTVTYENVISFIIFNYLITQFATFFTYLLCSYELTRNLAHTLCNLSGRARWMILLIAADAFIYVFRVPYFKKRLLFCPSLCLLKRLRGREVERQRVEIYFNNKLGTYSLRSINSPYEV